MLSLVVHIRWCQIAQSLVKTATKPSPYGDGIFGEFLALKRGVPFWSAFYPFKAIFSYAKRATLLGTVDLLRLSANKVFPVVRSVEARFVDDLGLQVVWIGSCAR